MDLQFTSTNSEIITFDYYCSLIQYFIIIWIIDGLLFQDCTQRNYENRNPINRLR